jgi:hypothetical protein
MFMLGVSSNNLIENLETLNIWPVEKDLEDVYESFFKPFGWCPYDFSLLIKDGEMQSINKGDRIYEIGGFEGNYCHLILDGTALFVLASEADSVATQQDRAPLSHTVTNNLDSDPESRSDLVSESIIQEAEHVPVEEVGILGTPYDIPRIEQPPQAYLCFGYLVKGQFDSLLTRASSQRGIPADKADKNAINIATKTDISNSVLSRTSLVAASDVKVLRIPRDKIRSLLLHQSRVRSLAAAIDAARQERARIVLSIEHANAMKQVAEYEDLVAKRLIQLLKM